MNDAAEDVRRFVGLFPLTVAVEVVVEGVTAELCQALGRRCECSLG